MANAIYSGCGHETRIRAFTALNIFPSEIVSGSFSAAHNNLRPLHRIAHNADIDVGRITAADALAAILGAFKHATLYD